MVRKDLSLSQQVVQACHAALELGKHRCRDPSTVDHLIVCQVPDESRLLEAYEYVQRHGVYAELFREPDLNDSATAFCTEAVCESTRKKFRKFNLWKEEPCLPNLSRK